MIASRYGYEPKGELRGQYLGGEFFQDIKTETCCSGKEVHKAVRQTAVFEYIVYHNRFRRYSAIGCYTLSINKYSIAA
jgi:hypothetical protein